MGVKSSKGGQPKPKECFHSPLPVDNVPYPGSQVSYLLCQVPVQMTQNVSFGFTSGRPMVTSNVDSYYPMLAQYYQQGYLLNTFYCVPGATQASGFGQVSMSYEAIFSKPGDGTLPEGGVPYELRIEKSMMFVQAMNFGVISFSRPQGTVADTNDILQKIAQHSSQGGRLVCIELTGYLQSQGMGAAMKGVSEGMGVDLFFNVPRVPSPPLYTYQAVNVPVTATVKVGFSNSVVVQCNWMGYFSSFLNQGWKLVEIFLDKGTSRQGGFSMTAQINTVWFFEKESARFNDPTPLYEGTIVTYQHTVKAGFGGTHVKSDWTPIIQEMGQKGWELACPLETPEQSMVGFGKISLKMLLFFQRRIIQGASIAPNVSPPPYQGGVPQQGSQLPQP